jgi:hypothetical protein
MIGMRKRVMLRRDKSKIGESIMTRIANPFGFKSTASSVIQGIRVLSGEQSEQ